MLLAALGSFAVYKIGDGKAEAIGRLEAASAKLAAMEAEAERTRQLHQELAAAKLVEQQLAARAQEAETRLATAAKEAETRTAAESDEEQLRTAVAVQVALQLASQQPEAPASDAAAPPEAPPEASCEGNGEASIAIKQSQGSTLTSLAGLTLGYSTLDSRLQPRNGFVVEVKPDVAGLGGDSRYFRVAGDARSFSFTMPPDAGAASYPLTIGLTADLGQTIASNLTATWLRRQLENIATACCRRGPRTWE